MVKIIDNIIKHHNVDFYKHFNGNQLYGVNATFNSTVCTAGTSVDNDSVLDRWRTFRLWEGFSDSGTITSKMHDDYVIGTDITIKVNWTTDTSTTGNAYYDVGLCRVPIGNIYDNDSIMVYKGLAAKTGPTATHEVVSDSFVFSGTNFQPGDDIAIVVYRVSGNAADTINDEFKIIKLSFMHKNNSKGKLII